MKFMALYCADPEDMKKWMAEMTPESQKKSMEEWVEWTKSHKEIVDIGAPLGKNWRVTKDGASQVSNAIGGYSVIEADSPEAAVAVLKGSPHFQTPGVYVELLPMMQM